MSVFDSRQVRAAYSQSVFVSENSLSWYVCTNRELRGDAKQLFPKVPIFGFEAAQSPVDLLNDDDAVFLVFQTDCDYVVRLNGHKAKAKKREVTEANVSNYLAFYGPHENHIGGGSLWGAWEKLNEEGLYSLSAGAGKWFDVNQQEPTLLAVLINPTIAELGPYASLLMTAAQQEPQYQRKLNDGRFHTQIKDLLAADG